MNEEKKTTQETKPEETKVEQTPERAEQISQIANLLSDKPVETEEVKTEVEEEKKPVVEETKTEKVETKEEKPAEETETEKKPEETKAEETKTETKPEEKPEEKEESEDPDHWRKQMNDMAKKIQGEAPVEEKKPAEETKAEETKVEKVAEPAEKVVKTPTADFTVTKVEFDKAMESEAGFQEVLQSKVSQISSGIVEGRLTEILRSIPKVINDAVDERVTIQLAASDFYRDNPDLTPFKSVVSLVATEVFGKNPGIEYDKGFEKVGEEVRKKLKMAKGAVKTATEKEEAKPAFVQGKTTRGIQTPDLTGVKSEIANVLDIE